MIHPDFRPGDNYYDYCNNELLEQATYYADGQIMDEDYVFGSFIQSKMYHKDIRCTDCHDPHSGQLKFQGNQVCVSCHQHAPGKYDTPAHHHHKSDSTGASCAECHMPETTYMEVDPRRDHSIRIPRPDLSVHLGQPNACTRCHLTEAKISEEKRATLPQYRDWMEAARNGDEEIRAELARLDQWALDTVNQWYDKTDWGDHYAFALDAGRRDEAGAADQLAALARDKTMPAIARATAILQRGLLRNPGNLEVEIEALKDEDPQVRTAAVARFDPLIPSVGNRRMNDQEAQFVRQQTEPIVRVLVPLLNDPRRSVRAETGRVLSRVPAQLVSELLNGTQREALDRAVDEYVVGLFESSDRGGAHMALAVLYESKGKPRRAEEAYRTAMRVEPRLTGPRSNLAALLEQSLAQDEQRYQGRPLPGSVAEKRREIETLRREELDHLARDAGLLPDNGAIQYRYGLSLYLHGQQEKAEEALKRAVDLEPDNDQFLLALVLFYQRYVQYPQALELVDKLIELQPNVPSHREFRKQLQAEAAAAEASRRAENTKEQSP